MASSDFEKIIAEIDKLSGQATFDVVKNALKELKVRQQSLLNQAKFQEAATAAPSKPAKVIAASTRPLTKVSTYAYDESEKYVKLYYTLNGVQNLPAENITPSFTDDSFEINVTDLDGKDFFITAKGFAHPIDPQNSVVKQKSDMLLVMLKKAKEGTWSELLKIVKSKDDEEDEEAGDVQGVFQKIFKNANDDAKRAMLKSYTESKGTVLSTNWAEIGKQKTEIKPPDNMEYVPPEL